MADDKHPNETDAQRKQREADEAASKANRDQGGQKPAQTGQTQPQR